MEFVGVNIFEVEDDQFRSGRIYTALVRDAGGVEQQLERMTRSADSADEAPAARRADSATGSHPRQIGLRQPSLRWRRPWMAPI